MRAWIVVAALCCAWPAWAAACTAQSGERTRALAELYTGPSCTGCPAAERWLATLGSRFAGRVVPLLLHVDYRDYLGRNHADTQARISGREEKLLRLQRMALVYTPRLVLQGHDFDAWGSDAFDAAVARINARPPAARLRLEIGAVAPSGLSVRVEAQVLDPQQHSDTVLYFAAFQRPRKDVMTHVVLEWQGPFAARAGGRFAEPRQLALLPTATPEDSGLAAFVQDRRTGEVLQALLLAACSP